METNWRKLFRDIHIHLAFVITGMVIIYGISGFIMNHLNSWGWDASYLPILEQMTAMHYNPNKFWTLFADIFAIGLIIVALTGLFIVKGKKGIKGIGGIEMAIGIIIPIVLYLLTTKLTTP